MSEHTNDTNSEYINTEHIIIDGNDEFNPIGDVKKFMIFADQVIGYKPGLRDQLLRTRLIAEEANETCQAIYTGDLIKTIDGLCDLIYVTLGTFIAFGIDMEPFWNEIQRSNMSKVMYDTVYDKFGKVTKPEDWTPPDIKAVFEQLYGPVHNYPAEFQSHNNAWQAVIEQGIKYNIDPKTDFPEMLLDFLRKKGKLSNDKH